MKNILRAQQILKWFQRLGVVDICICPGGRNAPFVVALEKSKDFSVTTGFDERATGFFAYGRAHSQQRPTVVITTSGTAVAELLPSVIESYYSAAPLIVVTADRPHALRGTGSPQVIEHNGIFGKHVEKCVDIDWNQEWREPQWNQCQPLHINISFEEPLIDAVLETTDFKTSIHTKADLPLVDARQIQISLEPLFDENKIPLLILGPLHATEVSAVKDFCSVWPGLIYAEASSGLREFGQMRSGEKYLSQLLKQKVWSGVLRLGAVPAVKLWRDLENTKIPVVSISSRPFSGLARGDFFYTSLKAIKAVEFHFPMNRELRQDILQKDLHLSLKQQELIKKFPKSEPALIHFLSKNISCDEDVYIGNSLPIREWDAFASMDNGCHLLVNRGANGIDGQIASALGMGAIGKNMSVVIGDLTALYDATGLWFLHAVKHLRLFVINNNGGRIFERLFNNSSFYNAHSVDFSAWAKMWNMKYASIVSTEAVIEQCGVYEVLPDAQETANFWCEYDQLFD